MSVPPPIHVRGASLSPALKARIRRRMLAWYDQHRRDLPWRRRSGDPYAQWVAEVMLQQTRVETVAAYYERFLRRFPNLAALASAELSEVLTFWQGLGYYRRALHLHRAAAALQSNNEPLPSTAAALRRLPGVGDYTAAAIASIAFGQRVAAVDGNVARVIARLFAIEEDVTINSGKRRVGELAQALLAPRRPGDFNQAWMDLGSIICTPRAPKCANCPLDRICVAARMNRAERLPIRTAGRNTTRTAIVMVVGIFVHGNKFLVRRRPEGGLWSGLWEFPALPLESGGGSGLLVRRMATEQRLRLTSKPSYAATVRRQLTHVTFTFDVYVAAVVDDDVSAAGPVSRWVSERSFAKLSVSTAHRRVHAAASEAMDRLKNVRPAPRPPLATRSL